MNLKKIFVLIGILSLFGCEKDDVCDATTPTTPRLVISFFDYANQANPRNVTNLKIIGHLMTSALVLTPTATDDSKYLTNANKIAIPLQTDANLTQFEFVLNATTDLTKATDDLQFNYSKTDVFVSRACGFKTIFDLSETNLPSFVINNDPTKNAGNWIKKIELVQPKINTENETHIKIYF